MDYEQLFNQLCAFEQEILDSELMKTGNRMRAGSNNYYYHTDGRNSVPQSLHQKVRDFMRAKENLLTQALETPRVAPQIQEKLCSITEKLCKLPLDIRSSTALSPPKLYKEAIENLQAFFLTLYETPTVTVIDKSKTIYDCYQKFDRRLDTLQILEKNHQVTLAEEKCRAERIKRQEKNARQVEKIVETDATQLPRKRQQQVRGAGSSDNRKTQSNRPGPCTTSQRTTQQVMPEVSENRAYSRPPTQIVLMQGLASVEHHGAQQKAREKSANTRQAEKGLEADADQPLLKRQRQARGAASADNRKTQSNRPGPRATSQRTTQQMMPGVSENRAYSRPPTQAVSIWSRPPIAPPAPISMRSPPVPVQPTISIGPAAVRFPLSFQLPRPPASMLEKAHDTTKETSNAQPGCK